MSVSYVMTAWAWLIAAVALDIGLGGGFVLGIFWAEAHTTKEEDQ